MSTKAIAGTRKALKELVDGTLRVQIDIEPRDKAAFHKLFPEIDTPVALAPLQLRAAGQTWGEQARQLVASGFFRSPDVWRAIANDKAYLNWLRDQPCARKTPGCDGQVVAAHVRRIEDGAGTGVKPEYSAIPLCHHHHSLQHQHGESVIGDPAWWQQARLHYVSKWAHESLKYQLSVESLRDLHPHDLYAWALEHGLEQYLPQSYKGEL